MVDVDIVNMCEIIERMLVLYVTLACDPGRSPSTHMYHRDSSFKNFPKVDIRVNAIPPKVDLHHIMY